MRADDAGFRFAGGDLPRAQQARIARALGGRDAYAREGFEFAVNDYLARLGRDIAPANRRLIFAVKDRAVNAFAYAGGVVGILEGMILFCRSESELLGIVAHEFAHLEQDHFRRMAAKNRVGAFAAVIGVVAGALVGGQGGTAIAAGARGYALSRQLAYSRDLEEEADAVGFNALVAAGINPDGLAAAFARMPDRGREYLQTHPGAIRRSQYLRARLAAVDLPPRPPSVDFALLRARLEFARAGRKQTIRAASAQLAQADAGSTAAAAARYALLVKEIEAGAPTRENLEAMSALAPESVFAALAAADGWPLLGEDEKGGGGFGGGGGDPPRQRGVGLAAHAALARARRGGNGGGFFRRDRSGQKPRFDSARIARGRGRGASVKKTRPRQFVVGAGALFGRQSGDRKKANRPRPPLRP